MRQNVSHNLAMIAVPCCYLKKTQLQVTKRTTGKSNLVESVGKHRDQTHNENEI